MNKGLVKCPACKRQKKAVCWGHIEHIEDGKVFVRLVVNPKYSPPENRDDEYTAELDIKNVLPRHRCLVRMHRRYYMFRPGVVEFCQCHYTRREIKKRMARMKKKVAAIFTPEFNEFWARAGNETYFKMLVSLVEQEKVETALDHIYEDMYTFIKYRRFDRVDEKLRHAIVFEVKDVDILVGLLTATLSVKGVKAIAASRAALYEYTNGLHGNISGLLAGLT